MTGLSDRAVQKSIRLLALDGKLRAELSQGRRSNNYVLTLNTVRGSVNPTPNSVQGSTPNVVHPNPERGSPQPRTAEHPTPNVVHPIRNDPSSEPSSEPGGMAPRSLSQVEMIRREKELDRVTKAIAELKVIERPQRTQAQQRKLIELLDRESELLSELGMSPALSSRISNPKPCDTKPRNVGMVGSTEEPSQEISPETKEAWEKMKSELGVKPSTVN